MKTDRYTKTILTIIAFCLVVNTLDKLDIIPKAYANAPTTPPALPTTEPKYGLVPLNEDGSITVKTTSPMDVNITGIRTSDDLDVKVSGINTSSSLNVNVNLEKIAGSSAYGGLPVKVIK
ncbi:hypothetical protein [Flavobacterium sp. AG291]|uniref:hypothetical protein n=1 Tax=Flavobacterium sp. AG291 TaxID=2184000 RepID=UPI000E2AFE2F|nr:hypothetical protein [Flavobacterium sp. AG291]RDI11077.1 hypothetical protein DEU42_1066 [Flavobacterium sp. AG291]